MTILMYFLTIAICIHVVDMFFIWPHGSGE